MFWWDMETILSQQVQIYSAKTRSFPKTVSDLSRCEVEHLYQRNSTYLWFADPNSASSRCSLVSSLSFFILFQKYSRRGEPGEVRVGDLHLQIKTPQLRQQLSQWYDPNTENTRQASGFRNHRRVSSDRNWMIQKKKTRIWGKKKRARLKNKKKHFCWIVLISLSIFLFYSGWIHILRCYLLFDWISPTRDEWRFISTQQTVGTNSAPGKKSGVSLIKHKMFPAFFSQKGRKICQFLFPSWRFISLKHVSLIKTNN